MSEVCILDCTLRDGGYYTNWLFDRKLVSRYLESISKSGIKYVELGFRSLPKKGFYGPFAYTTDDYLGSIEIPNNLFLGVMINAGSILSASDSVHQTINRIFSNREESSVSFVRVAAHINEIDQCKEILLELTNLGYKSFINLMQINNVSYSRLIEKVETIKSWNLVDVLYFADSMGNMSVSDVSDIVSLLKDTWGGEIGIHAHNNLGHANTNSLHAVSNGINWVDVTVTGMGRGAGNSQSEIMLNELSKSEGSDYYPDSLYELILEYFEPLQRKHGWGANFIYHYSAIHNIHPSYAQELLLDDRYSANEVISALKFLAESDSTKFISNKVHELLNTTPKRKISGKWDATDWCMGEDVLLLGAGPSLSEYSEEVELFIKSKKIHTLSVNYHNEISDELITSYVAADIRRLALDIKRYRNTNKPIILPYQHVPEELRAELSQIEYLDYDVSVSSDEVNIYKNGCILPVMLSALYAISLCIAGGAKRIFLVGFDGYSASDYRHMEMAESLDALCRIKGDVEIISLTPTTYPVIQGSIYAPY